MEPVKVSTKTSSWNLKLPRLTILAHLHLRKVLARQGHKATFSASLVRKIGRIRRGRPMASSSLSLGVRPAAPHHKVSVARRHNSNHLLTLVPHM